ncbi:MAG: hypothetical protein ACTHMC_09505 [Pseudobacter sp.]|uniref:hypothetical protein n=1 Tax=Pseudobacter sp. TaxID=2045420 RepID=UPI003F7DF8E2
MSEVYRLSGKILPVNKDIPNDLNKDRLLRYLDCTVIEYMHAKMKNETGVTSVIPAQSILPVFDSVRGAFIEGGPAFEGSGIFSKTHIQICIRNPNCIKGFFMPRQEISFQGNLKTF